MTSSIWVKTEPTLDSKSYVVTIEINDDRAITLTRDGAMRYAMTLLTVAQYAEYDAAVLAQISKLVDDQTAGTVIADLRRDRPAIDRVSTRPLTFEAGISHRTRQGFLTASLDGEPVWQWGPEDARQHAMHVLDAVIAADLDGAYYRELVGLVGLEEHVARNVIDDLRSHREGQ